MFSDFPYAKCVSLNQCISENPNVKTNDEENLFDVAPDFLFVFFFCVFKNDMLVWNISNLVIVKFKCRMFFFFAPNDANDRSIE